MSLGLLMPAWRLVLCKTTWFYLFLASMGSYLPQNLLCDQMDPPVLGPEVYLSLEPAGLAHYQSSPHGRPRPFAVIG